MLFVYNIGKYNVYTCKTIVWNSKRFSAHNVSIPKHK